jgi:hypothetical protein
MDKKTKRDLCINRNNHQKPTFHSLGDFLNPALALLGQGLKKSPMIVPIYAKVSFSFFIHQFALLGDFSTPWSCLHHGNTTYPAHM